MILAKVLNCKKQNQFHAASSLLFSAFERVDMDPQEVEYMEPRTLRVLYSE